MVVAPRHDTTQAPLQNWWPHVPPFALHSSTSAAHRHELSVQPSWLPNASEEQKGGNGTAVVVACGVVPDVCTGSVVVCTTVITVEVAIGVVVLIAIATFKSSARKTSRAMSAGFRPATPPAFVRLALHNSRATPVFRFSSFFFFLFTMTSSFRCSVRLKKKS